VIAIIERDADLQLAAKGVASARFSLRGKSPFAPDLVLVNEWVKKDFLSALVQHTSAFISDTVPKDPVQKLSKSRFHDTILKENLGEVVFSTSEGYILNVRNR
jgi:acyl-CoA reductase-like NAD-dependent aldehyde dehydrogenase